MTTNPDALPSPVDAQHLAHNLDAGDAGEPRTAAELVEVLDTMREVLGEPERMDSPYARAIYLLAETRLKVAFRQEHT